MLFPTVTKQYEKARINMAINLKLPSIARKTDDGREQLLETHADNVSKLAGRFAEKFGVGCIAKTVGKSHDDGKERSEWQEYILKPEDERKRGEVKHSIYGAKCIYDELKDSVLPLAEMLANCVIAHHGDLNDYLSPNGDAPLSIKLSNCQDGVPNDNREEIECETLSEEFKSVMGLAPNKEFALTMLTKLIYSCLVDADRLDAYLFESEKEYNPVKPDWDKALTRLEAYISRLSDNFPAPEMKTLREGVSRQCAEAGQRERGIYQLSVPTGGGKTLSSLRFALTHAKKHGLSRIIYVIPYLSVIEQTAGVVRDAVGADDFAVLEHHSDIVPDNPEYYKLQTDRWDEPLIITTQVQFLESIFSAKGTHLRKLHNMADSVLIFDEAQSLPVKCIHLFNSAVNFLHKVCNSTVLSCTATQPLLDKVERNIMLSDNPSVADCVKAPERYNIIDARKNKPIGYTFPELAEFILEKHSLSTLVIVNTKASAKGIAEELKNQGVRPLHLSTDMCKAHRDEVFASVKHSLETNESVICVSTQLIEAGVDISFECVIRDIAGLDSVFQAAGRCNRHGEFGEVKNVYIVSVKDESLNKLPDIKIGAEITKNLLDSDNLDIDEYYRKYFYERKNQMDYPFDGGSVYDLLTKNNQGKSSFANNGNKAKPPALYAAIRSAANEFYVIERGRTDVIVKYGESMELLDKYDVSDDLSHKRRLLKSLKKYTVSLYKSQLDVLRKRGALTERDDGINILDGGFYDKEFWGVDLDGSHEFLCG
jgi:CRISPR-associated endonuclease/helicase Cas3